MRHSHQPGPAQKTSRRKQWAALQSLSRLERPVASTREPHLEDDSWALLKVPQPSDVAVSPLPTHFRDVGHGPHRWKTPESGTPAARLTGSHPDSKGL
jgi:hypothetical protein